MPNKLTHFITNEQLHYVLDTFEENKDYRMKIICLLMPKGLRIQDVLDLTIEDVFHEDGFIPDTTHIREGKTKKHKLVSLEGKVLRDTLNKYWEQVKGLEPTSHLFSNHRGTKLTQDGVRYILHKKFDGKKGIRRKDFACHSFRKHGAREMYLKGGRDAILVSNILNHRDTSVTFTYIDLQPDEIKRTTSIVDI